ncbi:MAG: hypothetical protein JW909_10650 [Planctomycetes bacterium]|nr:hypothetical protein [Planctomycetota bacterium]
MANTEEEDRREDEKPVPETSGAPASQAGASSGGVDDGESAVDGVAASSPGPESANDGQPSVRNIPEAGSDRADTGKQARDSAPRYKSLVDYGKMFQQDWFFSFFDDGLKPGAKVVVKTGRGSELGKIVLPPKRIPDGEEPETAGRILRLAVAEDIARSAHIEQHDVAREKEICEQKIEEHGLKMSLVDVEHVLGGEKIVFYFMAEHRIDFRDLVKDLAREFHTRIELRQVGIRDKAKLLSDYEHCGRPLCCRTFLKELAPVGMRMAKTQRTTLDPGKISGCCGRLMCCLRFEESTYKWLLSRMPKRNSKIVFQGEEVKVVSLDPVADRITVVKEDGTRLTVSRSETSAADEPVQPASATEGESAVADDNDSRFPELEIGPLPDVEETSEEDVPREESHDRQPEGKKTSRKRRRRRRSRRKK